MSDQRDTRRGAYCAPSLRRASAAGATLTVFFKPPISRVCAVAAVFALIAAYVFLGATPEFGEVEDGDESFPPAPSG